LRIPHLMMPWVTASQIYLHTTHFCACARACVHASLPLCACVRVRAISCVRACARACAGILEVHRLALDHAAESDNRVVLACTRKAKFRSRCGTHGVSVTATLTAVPNGRLDQRPNLRGGLCRSFALVLVCFPFAVLRSRVPPEGSPCSHTLRSYARHVGAHADVQNRSVAALVESTKRACCVMPRLMPFRWLSGDAHSAVHLTVQRASRRGAARRFLVPERCNGWRQTRENYIRQ
jgi:hypothetical protein